MDTSTESRERPGDRLGLPVALAVLAGAAAALASYALASGVASLVAGSLVAGLATAAALGYGVWYGDRRRARDVQLRLYRVADELVQYRAFTRLLRAQADRVIDLSAEAAMVIATGLGEMDDRAGRVSELLERMIANDTGCVECSALEDLRHEAAAIADPVVTLAGKLQFQDVIRQQLLFLCKLSLLLDEHIAETARALGDRRSADRTTRFKELFDAALDDTVMLSQRNDHHNASGLELFETGGPAIELFPSEGGQT